MGGDKSESVEAEQRGHYIACTAEARVTQFLYSHIQTRKQHILMQQREREMVKAGSKLRIYFDFCQQKLLVAAVSPVFPTYLLRTAAVSVVTPGYEWEPALHCSHENI